MKEKMQSLAALVLAILFATLLLTNGWSTYASRSGSPGVPDSTKTLYDAKCAKCHGSNGRGRTLRGKFDHARDFTDAGWQNDVSDERLFNSINNGRGKMPSFKKKLTEQQVNELVTYVRHFRQ